MLEVEAAPGEPEAETVRRGALVAGALAERGVPAERVRVEADPPTELEGSDPAPDRIVVRVEGCDRR